ncbi:MAG: flagellar biosynthesis protein FlhF [Pseudohongiellaceae bacterium]
MAVKKFYASDMRAAMKSIRDQLGDDAVILSTRKLDDGVEVSASADAAELANGAFSQNTENSFSANRGEGPADSRSQPSNSASVPWFLNSISGFEEEHSALQSELGGMKTLLENWMDQQGWENFSSKSPLSAKLWERLRNMGLDADHINPLLASLPADLDIGSAWQFCLTEFSKSIPMLDKDLVAEGGVFAFMGSAGVGKTTTIGKLATRYVLEHGADSIALITTDRFRIAAHEQLRTYGKILGVSVQAVDENNSLETLLNAFRHKKLVLIDTAGISINHPSFAKQYQQFSQLRQRINPVLLISSTSQIQVLKAEMMAYRSIGPVASVLTKTDEALRLGESLGLLSIMNCPLAYITFGQSIPDDIAIGEPNKLVNKAVVMSRQPLISKDQLIAGFNSVYSQTVDREVRAAV